tara:strand:- start:683 stop:805 length:123 start_codon:yes stop_codon:yes gene_type:complete
VDEEQKMVGEPLNVIQDNIAKTSEKSDDDKDTDSKSADHF